MNALFFVRFAHKKRRTENCFSVLDKIYVLVGNVVLFVELPGVEIVANDTEVVCCVYLLDAGFYEICAKVIKTYSFRSTTIAIPSVTFAVT